MNRLDYFAAAFSPEIKLFNFKEKINANVNTSSDKVLLTAYVNGENVTVPNLPLLLNKHIHAKFDSFSERKVKTGIQRK